MIYLAALAVGFGLQALLPSTPIPDGLAWTLGGAMLLVGIWFLGSFFAALRGAGTPVDPYRATTAIVTSGPYRLSRNPGYLGMALVYAGICLLSEVLWALVLLAPALIAIDRGVIAREERYLERKFGPEYLGYKARTRRWL